MYSVAKTLGLLCLNAGWLIPGYLCISSLIQWCQIEASPIIYGTERQMNSFPFLHFSQSMALVATVWLGLALVFHTLWPSAGRRRQRTS